MLGNKCYFDYSKDHSEPLFDPYYKKDKKIIPFGVGGRDDLVKANERLISLIDEFQAAEREGKTLDDDSVKEIVGKVKSLLDRTKGINLSPFCQFFMVYNFSYSVYKKLSSENKDRFLYEMLAKYCDERHDLYRKYGYSDSMLQVVCDSYSHKSNGEASINKFIDLLKPYITYNLQDENRVLVDDDYYFLPDKTGKKCFAKLLEELGLKMESRKIEQNKSPDLVFKHDGQYYIFELKMMKGSGGGQNKQAVEFIHFISFTEEDLNVHYGVMLDGLYVNELFESTQPKVVAQRNDVLQALKDNPGNYFVNTAGVKLLLRDIFADKNGL